MHTQATPVSTGWCANCVMCLLLGVQCTHKPHLFLLAGAALQDGAAGDTGHGVSRCSLQRCS